MVEVVVEYVVAVLGAEYVEAEPAGGASASEVPAAAPDGRMVGYSGPRTGMRPPPLSSVPNERLPLVLSGSDEPYGEYAESSVRWSGSRKAPLGRSCTPDSYGPGLVYGPGGTDELGAEEPDPDEPDPVYQLGVCGSSA